MRILYTVTAEVEPSTADAWNQWHAEIHVPEVVAQPGFIRCRRWRDVSTASDGWVRYLSAYEVATREAFERYDQGEAKRLRADGVKRFGDKVRYQRAVFELCGSYGGAGHVGD